MRLASSTVALVTLVVAACAPHRVATRIDPAAGAESAPDPASGSVDAGQGASLPALDQYGAYLRKTHSAAGRPLVRNTGTTVERSNPELSVALAFVAAVPSSGGHVDVARAYRRAGVMDKAHEHLGLAVKLDGGNASAYDELARIWRDWRLPAMALPDAHRAVYYAPWSPEAHNTLGTVFHALGFAQFARGEYYRTLALDPQAAYALNNLCALDLVVGDPFSAARRCAEAARLDPALSAATRNLEQARALIRTLSAETPDGER